MQSAQPDHQRYERKTRTAFGHGGTSEKCDELRSGVSSKTDISRNQRLGREHLWRGDGTAGERERERILEEMSKEGRNDSVKEGRVTVTVGGGVTRLAVLEEAEVEPFCG